MNPEPRFSKVAKAVWVSVGLLLVCTSVTAVACATRAASSLAVETLAGQKGDLLFAAHCAACHGSTGRGDGPAAIALLVRPRDFRQERFRYVSTLNGVPTDQDLIQSIRFGRRYGEMPAHPQLADAEIWTLVEYVREIQRLGWMDELNEEFSDDEDSSPEELEEISHIRVKPRNPVEVVQQLGFQRDIDVGRKLYAANCQSCHGATGRGDGLNKPLDERGNAIRVRDLTSGRFRGGTGLHEVFKRIRCGVPGTPMSAAVALTDEETWQLSYYVRFLAGR